MLVIGECYANTCLAKRLLVALSPGADSNYLHKLIHKPYLGRDKAIKKALNAARWVSDAVLIVIDYERGVSRKYVEANFSLTEVCPGVLVGKDLREARVLAVVLDPNFEDGLLCIDREFGEMCEDRDLLDAVKSSSACSALSEFLEEFTASECFVRIVEVLRKMLSGSGSQ